jgi:hypothetical protein
VRIVIDINTLSAVFDASNHLHAEFEPVLAWILGGKGKMVYGGKRYRQELARVGKLRRLLVELQTASKIVPLDDREVDRTEAHVKAKVSYKTFDDAYIIAIVIVGRCPFVCTNDKRSHRFITMKTLYPKGFCRPKIYSGLRTRALLGN